MCIYIYVGGIEILVKLFSLFIYTQIHSLSIRFFANASYTLEFTGNKASRVYFCFRKFCRGIFAKKSRALSFFVSSVVNVIFAARFVERKCIAPKMILTVKREIVFT